MDATKLRFGEIIARLPEKTLVKHTSPPFEYWLIPGGFLDSEVPSQAAKTPSGRSMISFNVDDTESGGMMAYLDRERKIR